MSSVNAAWVDALLARAFGADPGPVVRAFVDPSVCAGLISGSKLGIVARPGGVAVRVAHDGESARLFDVAKKAFPAVGAWLDAHAGRDVLFETDGRFLRVYVYGVEGAGGAVGVVWQDGVAGTIHPSEAPAGVPAGGEWVELRLGAATSRLGVYGAGTTLAGRGGPAVAAVVAHYGAAGLTVAPWSIEVGPDGESVCAWGADGGPELSKLPDVFEAGAPDAGAWAGVLAGLVDDDHRAAAEARLRELHGLVSAARPDGASAVGWLGEAWRFVATQVAGVGPRDRLARIERVVAVHRMPGHAQRAFHVAVARYLASHEQGVPPAGLPDDLVGLDDAAARARAEQAAAAFEADARLLADVAEPDALRFVDVPFELGTIREILARALSGEFHVAPGALHDYLVSLGTLGYDDDPSMVSIEDVDLEPGARDAAIEEALARQDEDEF